MQDSRASDPTQSQKGDAGPLEGLRVLELGHFVAAPFCTRILADLGAEVIKIEPPTGDPVRSWGESRNGHSYWWSVHGRNKKSVSLNLKSPAAKDIILKLVENCDVLVENFRPGYLARIGFSNETLHAANPELVISHISGFGQDGPYRDRPAFGVIGEAMGGLRYLTNHAPGTTDLPSVRVGVSIGDSLAGLYAAIGILAELWRRNKGGANLPGSSVDVALTESVLSLMEGMLPEYGALGKIREPSGSRIPTAAPSSAYPTRDGKWILIAANSEALVKKLFDLLGKPELTNDPRFATNPLRVENVEVLDDIIGAWTKQLDVATLQDMLVENSIPSTPIYDASDCAADPQFRYREMVREISDPNLGNVLHPGIVPRHNGSAGKIRWAGPEIGAQTQDVLKSLADMTDAQIEELRQEGMIAWPK